MRTVIEDTWFPAGTKIRVGKGADELSFLRCTFEGGEIFIEPDVERTIFLHCVFQHTRFSGQPLSERIAVGCRHASVDTEASAIAPVARHARFRR
jgi:hypothetical protein